MTETSPVTHANPLTGTRRTGMIGIPIPGTRARIVDPDDPSRPDAGRRARRAGRSPGRRSSSATGTRRRRPTPRPFTADGWLLTGDIAVMDDDGWFTVVDRKKDLIIAGGFNIYPSEVEGGPLHDGRGRRLLSSSGVPDRYRGETVKAFIVLQPGATLTEADVKAHCARAADGVQGAEVRGVQAEPAAYRGRQGTAPAAAGRGNGGEGHQRMTKILVVDNYDSFVFNLVQYLAQLGAEVEVRGNVTFPPDEVYDPRKLGVDGILISPGPGRPEDAGLLRRPDPRLCPYGAAVARRLPRPPGDRGRLRRRVGPAPGAAARQDQRGRPRGRRRAGRAAEPVHGDALPLARRRRRTPCRPSSRSPRAPTTAP